MSKSVSFDEDAMLDFQNLLKEYESNLSDAKVSIAIAKGAEEFKEDLNKLPRPYRQVRTSGYTHLVRSFAVEKTKGGMIVGWGKYYGPIVEAGSKHAKAQPHFRPLWNKNKDKYYRRMIDALGI